MKNEKYHWLWQQQRSVFDNYQYHIDREYSNITQNYVYRNKKIILNKKEFNKIYLI